MGILTKELRLWALWLLFFSFSFTASHSEFKIPDNPSITYIYTRSAEIEKHCGFIMSSASELEPDDNRGYRMLNELFFRHGDWDQDSGGAPLMPLDDSNEPNTFGYGFPLKLASFWVMDVNPVRRAKNVLSVSAVLQIGISRGGTLGYRYPEWSPKFFMERGISVLTVLFEGIYVESEDNGGEHLMCLLGNATIPISQFDDSIESMGEYGFGYNHKPQLVPDDQIMLVLRFPKTFSLTTRSISGEMKSLNQKWNLTYFDKVHISSSQLGGGLKYQFGPEELLSKACSPYPYQDSLVDEAIEMFKGEEFVSIWTA